MSPRTKFWLLMVAAWTLIGLAWPVPGLYGVACSLSGGALTCCALRVIHNSRRSR